METLDQVWNLSPFKVADIIIIIIIILITKHKSQSSTNKQRDYCEDPASFIN